MNISISISAAIAALNTAGFEVSLRPLGGGVALALPAPVPAKPVTSMAARVDAELAPHGFGPDGAPLAPFGFRKDGVTPRKSAAGRPVKGETQTATVKVSPPTVQTAPAAPAVQAMSLDLGSIFAGVPASVAPRQSAASALAQLESDLGL